MLSLSDNFLVTNCDFNFYSYMHIHTLNYTVNVNSFGNGWSKGPTKVSPTSELSYVDNLRLFFKPIITIVKGKVCIISCTNENVKLFMLLIKSVLSFILLCFNVLFLCKMCISYLYILLFVLCLTYYI